MVANFISRRDSEFQFQLCIFRRQRQVRKADHFNLGRPGQCRHISILLLRCAATCSAPQREKLAELRQGAEYVSQVEELDVASLIEKCWPLRLDLDYEDDIAFIEQERGSSSIKRRHVERLLRCCRKLGVITPIGNRSIYPRMSF